MGDTLYIKDDRFKEFLLDIYQLKLRKLTHEQVRLMFETLLYGALRISEVLQITPLDLSNGKIRLRITKGGIKRCKCAKWVFRPTRLLSSDPNCDKCHGTGKYRIDSYAWVLPEVYAELVELAKTKRLSERLFPLSRVRVWQYVDQLLDGRTHTFRHSFLTWMIENEKFNVRDIMQKGRHKSLAVTTAYIEKNPDVTQHKEDITFNRI